MKLKRFFITTFSALLLTPAMPVAVVFAVEGEETTTTSTTETNPDEKAALQERLAKRKAELNTRLTNAQKLALKGKCKAAQGKLSSVSGRSKGIETSRSKVHANIVKHLTGLSEKLKNKGADTTELDAAVVTLQEKITTFNDDLAIYKQAIADLETMDCIAEPDGFKASLDTARAALEAVKQDASDIRAYVKDTIKPLLQTIRRALEKKEE